MGLNKYIDQGSKIAASRAAQKEYGLFARELNRDLAEVIKKLNAIPKDALSAKERKKALRKASKPLIAAAQAKAPVMRQRRKVTISLKNGEKVTYYAGNLRLSIKEITLRKGGASVFIGPKVTRRRKGGEEYGKVSSKVDAFYAAMVEYGTPNMSARPYMRPAYEATKQQVIQIATKEVINLVTAWARKNEVRR